MARSLQDLTAFLLVPEGLGRELRGQGLAAWARENVTHQLWAPPPGTVRVRSRWRQRCMQLGWACGRGPGRTPRILSASPCCRLQVLVVSLDGCRCSILLRGAATLADLRQEVQRQAGVAADRQRLLALQQRALSPAQRLALAALRLLVAAALWAAGWLAAAARWLLDLPPAEASLCSLALVTESGRRVELAVGPDTTLAQLQERVFQRYGEHVSLSHLCVSPERGGGGG